MTPTLAAAIRELMTDPALAEALGTLSTVLAEEAGPDQLAAIADTCVSPAEVEALQLRIVALAVALQTPPPVRH
jgi:hypothetical protein